MGMHKPFHLRLPLLGNSSTKRSTTRTAESGVWYFVTFGGGDFRYRIMARRLGRQAKHLPRMRPLTITDRNLHRVIGPQLAIEVKRYAVRAPRGFGFMLWKPLIIQALFRRPETAGVVYADAGCEVNATESSVERFERWVDEASCTGHRVWYVEGEWSERMYTKSDLLTQVPLAADALDERQIQSGVFILAKTQTSHHLVEQWATLAQLEHHHFLDESASETSTEDAQFVAHRHDQSIFSSLAKSHGWQPVDNETHFGPDRRGTAGATYPIWTVRNRRLLSVRSPRWLRSIESLGARAWARNR
jgi:hypothetical protein